MHAPQAPLNFLKMSIFCRSPPVFQISSSTKIYQGMRQEAPRDNCKTVSIKLKICLVKDEQMKDRCAERTWTFYSLVKSCKSCCPTYVRLSKSKTTVNANFWKVLWQKCSLHNDVSGISEHTVSQVSIMLSVKNTKHEHKIRFSLLYSPKLFVEESIIRSLSCVKFL